MAAVDLKVVGRDAARVRIAETPNEQFVVAPLALDRIRRRQRRRGEIIGDELGHAGGEIETGHRRMLTGLDGGRQPGPTGGPRRSVCKCPKAA